VGLGEPAAPVASGGGLVSAFSVGGAAALAAAVTFAARQPRPLAARAKARAVGCKASESEPAAIASPSPFGPGPFDATKQVGALPPLDFWDPAGLCTDEATFRKYRTAEIKHGRVAMMAAIGLTVAHGNKFPWIDPGTSAGLAAFESPSAAQAFGTLFIGAGFYELWFWTESESKEPGNFGDPSGWMTTFPSLKYESDLRNRELNNGRFAMFVVIGILVAEQQTGLDGVDQLNAAVRRWGEMGGFENF